MSEHTPGPWNACELTGNRYPWAVGVRTDQCDTMQTPICFVEQSHIVGRGGANARLIAAAPETARQRDELLAALKAMMAMADRGPKPRKLDDAGTWRENDKLAWSLARAAIAKGEGREVPHETPA